MGGLYRREIWQKLRLIGLKKCDSYRCPAGGDDPAPLTPGYQLVLFSY